MNRVARYLLLLSLILCSLNVCLTTPSATASSSTIDLEHRIKLFNQVWELIHDEHYNPRFAGPEWERVRERYLPRVKSAHDNEEFYQVLRELAWEADSSHTAFLPDYDGRDGDVGVLLKRIDDRVVVTKVIAGSPASRVPLHIGEEIVSAGGIPASALHLNPIESELRGEADSNISLVIRQLDGRVTEHQVTRRPVDLDIPIEWRVLSSGVGYIRIYNFTGESRLEQFQRAYANLKNAPGLIIDVRGPNGGMPSIVGGILGYFIDRVEMMTFRDRHGHGFKSYTIPQKTFYQGHLAVLIDERSRSGQEIFANTLKEHSKAVIVGTKSCGCVEGGNYINLGDNQVLEIAHYAVWTPKSGNLEDAGVEPDRIVPMTERDILRGRDPQIQAAEQELLTEIGSTRKTESSRAQ